MHQVEFESNHHNYGVYQKIESVINKTLVTIDFVQITSLSKPKEISQTN